MNNLAIWTHQGMGDIIICNAIFRNFASKYEKVVVPAKHPNTESCAFMLRDVPNIEVIPIFDDDHGMRFMRETWIGDKLFLGGAGNDFRGSDFDQCFYRQAGIPFDQRWIGWYCHREQDESSPIGRYSFVHDDEGRGMTITRKPGESGLPVHHPVPGYTNNIFKYILMLEMAREVHCIDSSFALLADSLPEDISQKLFIHRYARPSDTIPTYRRNWIILT